MIKLSDHLRSESVNVDKLSAKAGVAPERMRALAADAEPTLGELRRIASALGIPMLDFAGAPSATDQQADLLFRKAIVAGKPVSPAAVSSLSRRMSRSFELLRSSRQGGAPWWLSEFEHGDETLQSAERNASIFRKLFCNDDQLSPLLSLPKIVIDRMEAMLFVVRSQDFDGASAFFDGVPFAFVSARFRGRMLFTLAHECGHLVSHHNPEDSFAIIDEAIEDAPVADPKRASSERYADAFASALLMPSMSTGLTLKKVREIAKITDNEIGDLEIGYLARIFGVSFWAAARRCEDLSLLPRGGAAALNDRIAKEYGSAEKRGDEAGLPPRPEIDFPRVPWPLMASAVERVRAGELSVGRAAAIVGLSISDLMAANAPTEH